jgi:hypothetical protein
MAQSGQAVQAIEHLRPFRRGDRVPLDEDVLHIDDDEGRLRWLYEKIDHGFV